MKIAIIGGHLTPALAVMNAMPKSWEIVYIGRQYAAEGDKAISLEYQTITAMGIPFVIVSTAKFQRKFTKYTVLSFSKMPQGLMQAFHLLQKYKPEVILSFGGYVSLPVCFAGYLLKIPIVIHEQTTQAGMANKLVSLFAKKICISFVSSQSFFPKKKVILTGNPVLQTIQTEKVKKYKKLSPNLPLLVIVGGSQGSHILNILIEGSLGELLQKFQIIHQTGDATEFTDFGRLEKLRLGLPVELQERYLLVKFIHPDDITYVFKEADIIVSRAGINTVLTLLLLNKPALLIPLPHGQKNEQLRNARMFVEEGLGVIAKQKGLTSEILKDKIFSLYQGKNNYRSKNLIRLRDLHMHAAERVVEVVKAQVIQS